ncbi:MAG: hypothetical protein J6O41_05600, partial [Clostridia bacterium]|nr:hypothetical protein [Clostridia bacterium]
RKRGGVIPIEVKSGNTDSVVVSISFFIFISFKLIPYYALISIGVLVCSISFLLGYIQNKTGETK